MQRNGLLLPLSALLLAIAIAVGLALDFRLAGEAERAHQAAVRPATLDGRIDEDEYARSYRDETTGMTLYWTIVGEEIFIGLRCPDRGWVAVGLGGEGPMMKGADILIAYVDATGVHVQDNYGDDAMTHVADGELGGSDDISERAGSEGEGGTVVELRRALDTGDEYDQAMTKGEMRVLLAHADADDFTSYHKSRSTSMIDFFEVGP